MHLHGERFFAIEKLEQQRKSRLRMMAAEQFLAAIGPQFAQRGSGQRSVGDAALIVAAIDQFPAFGVIVPLADGFPSSVPSLRPPQT